MARDKHHDVWRELIRYNGEIYHFIFQYINNSEVASDICQDVYLQAVKNIDSLKIEKNIRAWLYKVAKNISINYLKSKQIRRHIEFEENLKLSNESSYYETTPFIEKAFASLPERQRIALQLREIDGYSYEELAKEMSLSESAVTSLLSRARESFQRNYLISLLPDSISKISSRTNNIDDLLRYIDPDDPPINLKDELKELMSAYYKSVSREWDLIRDHFFEAQDLKGIFDRVDFNYDESLLDLGTGTGFIALHFAPFVGEVIGLDHNEEMLKLATQKKKRLGISNVSFVKGEIEQMPFYGKKFDIVFANLVLHHLIDPAESLKQVSQVLKRNGKLILVDFKRHANQKMANEMKDIWLGFSHTEIKKWLQDLYFSKIDHFILKAARKSTSFPEIFCIIATY